MPPVRDTTASSLVERVGRNVQHRCGIRDGARLLAGVSGGADSVAMLRLLIALAPRSRFELVVGHFDHALRPDSALDATFVRDLARAHGIAFETARWDQPAAGEAAARRARHAFLQRVARTHACDAIVLAHQLEDRIETALLQLGRGAGPRGLAGIAWRRDGAPPVVRPLLDVPRAALRGFLTASGQAWREDPTNRTSAPRRNRVRKDILPVLDTTLPSGWMQRWGKSLDDLLDVRAWLDTEAAALLASAPLHAAGDVSSCTRAALQAAPTALRRAALQRWIGTEDVGRAHLEAADRLIRDGQSGQWIALPAGRRLALEQEQVTLLHAPAGARVHAEGTVEVEAMTADAARAALERAANEPSIDAVVQLESGCDAVAAAGAIAMPLEVRRCRTGDRVRLLGAPGAKSVHRILQARRVPERLRGGWPLVCDAQGIVWIPGVGVAERGRIDVQTAQVLGFSWRPRQAARAGLRNPIQVLTLE